MPKKVSRLFAISVAIAFFTGVSSGFPIVYSTGAGLCNRHIRRHFKGYRKSNFDNDQHTRNNRHNPTKPTTQRYPASAGALDNRDFHSHTWLSDGKHTQAELLNAGFGKYGLDWIANNDHGGAFGLDPNGTPWDDPSLVQKVKVLGDPPLGKMPRMAFIHPCGAGSPCSISPGRCFLAVPMAPEMFCQACSQNTQTKF